MRCYKTEILLMFIVLIAVKTVSCSIDENCVWTYKCCEFKETDGEVKCEKMCEPEIQCKVLNNDEMEKLEVENNAPSSIRVGCSRGFQYYDDKCRRVFGKTRERLQKPTNLLK